MIMVIVYYDYRDSGPFITRVVTWINVRKSGVVLNDRILKVKCLLL